MTSTARLSGQATPFTVSLANELRRASIDVVDGSADASLLVALPDGDAEVIAAATGFASSIARGGTDHLVIALLERPAKSDWPTIRTVASLQAFIRYAALAWAPKRIRINGVMLMPNPAGMVGQEAGDVAAAILGIRRWRSMTGQTIQLNGV